MPDDPAVEVVRASSARIPTFTAAIRAFLGDDVSPQHVDVLYDLVRRAVAAARRHNMTYEGVDR